MPEVRSMKHLILDFGLRRELSRTIADFRLGEGNSELGLYIEANETSERSEVRDFGV